MGERITNRHLVGAANRYRAALTARGYQIDGTVLIARIYGQIYYLVRVNDGTAYHDLPGFNGAGMFAGTGYETKRAAYDAVILAARLLEELGDN